MKPNLLIILLFFSAAWQLSAQQLTQSIRGTVTDAQSDYPLPGVNILVINAAGFKTGTATDQNGKFTLENIPTGRVDLQFTLIGYEPAYKKHIALTSGKEMVLNVKIKESPFDLDEVVLVASKVKIQKDKAKQINEMAMVSVRGFSTEEAFRFAGSRQDPARMAANFAGVSGGDDSRNDIIIRGNSPLGLLWRVEGLDIPSPNHFSSLGSTGGPVSMLNNNLIDNSDFFSSAFPAEYGNALSGVFDINLRKGNASKHEFTGQIAFNGFEFGAEGPLGIGNDGSYLISGRYSVLSVFDKLGINLGTGTAVPNYADLSINIDIPTSDAGRFSLFSILGNSTINLNGSEFDRDDVQLSFGNLSSNINNENHTVITGLSHHIFLTENTSIKNTLGFSSTTFGAFLKSVHRDADFNVTALKDSIDLKNEQSRITWHSRFISKINARSNLKIGVITNRYESSFTNNLIYNNFYELDFRGSTYLLQAYASWKQQFGNLTAIIAGHYQKFFLNQNSQAIEPRVSLQYKLSEKAAMSLGYGRHSQTLPTTVYFFQKKDNEGKVSTPNKSLGFSKSDQLVVGYDYNINTNFRLKVEAYQQWLSDIPVHTYPSTFSMINYTEVDFVTDLTNKGSGFNRGIEITLERFFHDSYYFLITGSLYESKYKGSDNITRNSLFNGNHNLNALFGKEFKVGENTILSFDMNYTQAGGRRYTPIDLQKSKEAGKEVLDTEQTYEKQLAIYARLDLRLGFTLNLPGVTQEWVVDLQNVFNRENEWKHEYDTSRDKEVATRQLGILPVFLYRITF